MPKGQYLRTYRADVKFVDLVGQRFGKRVVIARAPTPIYRGKLGSSMWVVKCDCGKESTIATSSIKNTTSCGCDFKDAAIRSGKTRKSLLPLSAPRNVSHLKRTYKLSLDAFEERRKEQNNCCAICGSEFLVTPSVDHDHSCCLGRTSCGFCIRGLLCRNCNAGIGNLRDSPELLEKAAVYLRGYASKDVNKP